MTTKPTKTQRALLENIAADRVRISWLSKTYGQWRDADGYVNKTTVRAVKEKGWAHATMPDTGGPAVVALTEAGRGVLGDAS